MTPNFNDLIYFVEIAQTENISRAAERLAISQPSLSTSIKRLEDALGTQLLLRTKAGVRLTKEGQAFMTRVKDLIQQWESLRDTVQRSSTEAVGRYKIGCHSAVAQYALPQFLPDLLKENPRLEVQLYHDLSRKICEQVISFELDFGLVVNPIAHPDLVIRELCTDVVQFWVSAQKSLANQDVLICDDNLLQTQELLQKIRKRKNDFARHIHSTSLEVIATLTASGTGVGILPTRVAQLHKLKIFHKDLPQFTDRICLVYRGDSPKTFASKTIIEAIRSIC